MIIATSEKAVDLRWVCEETALILLDEHDDKEKVEVKDLKGKTLFVVSFGALKILREARNGSRLQNVSLNEMISDDVARMQSISINEMDFTQAYKANDIARMKTPNCHCPTPDPNKKNMGIRWSCPQCGKFWIVQRASLGGNVWFAP